MSDAGNEMHKHESYGSVLLYTLKQDGWRKGEPFMVNDVMIRIDNANGSDNDLAEIADMIIDAWNTRPCPAP